VGRRIVSVFGDASDSPPLAAGGAIAFDNADSVQGAPATSLTITNFLTSGTNRYITAFAGAASSTPPTITALTYGGTALDSQDLQFTGQYLRSRLYGKAGMAAGSANVVVTYSGTASEAGFGVISFTGVDQASPVRTAIGANAISASPTISVSSAVDDVVVDGAWLGTAVDSIAPGTGQTLRWSELAIGGPYLSGGGSTENGAANVTMSWTGGPTLNEWCISALSLKPA
jgi:hypothetical protein